MKSRLILCLLISVFMFSCPSKQKSCPQDMVYVSNGGFCVDMFEYPNRRGTAPRVEINFIEAKDICRNLGKRLPTNREWVAACKGKKGTRFPYGNSFISKKCHTGLSLFGDAPAASGSYSECVSDYGIYDLTGNVEEWVIGSSGKSMVIGGGWYSTDGGVCGEADTFGEENRNFGVGFRCFADPLKQ